MKSNRLMDKWNQWVFVPGKLLPIKSDISQVRIDRKTHRILGNVKNIGSVVNTDGNVWRMVH
jgi:hypothetical protein